MKDTSMGVYSHILKNIKKRGKQENKKQQEIRNKYIKEQPIWDIYFAGHGLKDVSICGLKIELIQKILEFFIHNIDVGSLLLSSCHTAGTNIEKIKFQTELQNNNVLRSINYILIVEGIDETVLIVTKMNFDSYFDTAEQIGNKKASIEKLLKESYYSKNGGGEIND